MRARIVIALLLSFATCAFAAEKKIKQPPSSTGILIASSFTFNIMGDGISTTFTINPYRIGTILPILPLVGLQQGGNFLSCNDFVNQILFTATLSGREIHITLQSPPAADTVYNCYATLLFQPE